MCPLRYGFAAQFQLPHPEEAAAVPALRSRWLVSHTCPCVPVEDEASQCFLRAPWIASNDLEGGG